VQFSSIADLLKEIQSAEEQGMKFADKVPDPSTVIEY
jgi:hypothetical protein